MTVEDLVKVVNEAFGVFLVILDQDDAEQDLISLVKSVNEDLVDVITGKLTPQPQQ